VAARIDHWREHARLWGRIGSPLRPAAEDLDRSGAWIAARLAPSSQDMKALILGVTPELALIPWPAGTRVIGVDRSIDMVRNAWPAAEMRGHGLAVNGDWRTLPLPDASMSLAIGDGSYSNLDSIADYDRLSRELRRVLRPGGHMILRLYVRPEQMESPDVVIDALLDGWTDNFNAFKLRLMMAMSPDPDYSIRVADTFDLWSSRGFDYDDLSRQIGISRETIEAMDNYRGSATCYNFPPNTYVAGHFARHFDLIDTFMPTYTLGERCPTLLLARR
jgi:SAM-dependent methyltransferase